MLPTAPHSIDPAAAFARWHGTGVLAQAAVTLAPFDLPYGNLANLPGWILWLGHPPVPDGLPLLPAPSALLWDDPAQVLALGAAVALDYAARRGAADPAATRALLGRESPLAVLVPGEVSDALDPLLAEATALGLPVVRGGAVHRLAVGAIPAFASRETGHAAALGRPHDPALAFETVAGEVRIGGNPLSSYVLHHEGERDGVEVVGEPSARVGIEVGVLAPGVDLAATAALEAEAAAYPGFLQGVTSHVSDHSLAIGWEGIAPTPVHIGEAIRVWLKAIHRLPLVDVRIAFAPPQGRSARLVDMRARAAEFKEIRTLGEAARKV
ncbi:MAG: hypothetical protein AVDCRST_MAG73-2590 [uncultured Thermomicrobiales bacterium]|uniref:Uncharacterized protein n=1 Tax=uncultured Thermomicrobiales bacterium TaxID=1645740 RepID=A0A6J4UEA3_9BACT|nr:MAG: hypothetical protein AVDCRST_MAG73-2590 [uncultured Thermomicrobiales bacterium]